MYTKRRQYKENFHDKFFVRTNQFEEHPNFLQPIQ